MAEDDAYRQGLDALQADMAAHQRRFKGEVTADANQKLATDLIQQVERQQTSQPPANDSEPAVQLPLDLTPEKREINGEKYVIQKEVENSQKNPLLRKASEAELWFINHAMPRIELLLSKEESGPLGAASWKDRTLAVFALKTQAEAAKTSGQYDLARQLDKRYIFELTCLLEASSATFGDWKKDAPKRVSVSG